MLITRGFGVCTGGGRHIPTTYASRSGKSNMQSSVKLPSVSSAEDIITPPSISTNTVDTDLDVSHLTPKITTNLPKF